MAQRLDTYLEHYYSSYTLKEIQSFIMRGKVFVNDQKECKPGRIVKEKDHIDFRPASKQFVSRGGHKLEGALSHFHVDVTDKVCLDLGVSTGGFTDCLLQHGADHVIGIDVSYGLTDFKIRSHPKVSLIERTNVKALSVQDFKDTLSQLNLPSPSLVVMDLSFISSVSILQYIYNFFDPGTTILCLIKPQFEAPSDWVEDGGILPSHRHEPLLSSVKETLSEWYVIEGLAPSCIKGQKGNQEYFIYLSYR